MEEIKLSELDKENQELLLWFSKSRGIGEVAVRLNCCYSNAAGKLKIMVAKGWLKELRIPPNKVAYKINPTLMLGLEKIEYKIIECTKCRTKYSEKLENCPNCNQDT